MESCLRSWYWFLATFVHGELVEAPFLEEHIEMVLVTFLTETMSMQCIGVICLFSRQGSAEVGSLSLKRAMWCSGCCQGALPSGGCRESIGFMVGGFQAWQVWGLLVMGPWLLLVAVFFRGGVNCRVGTGGSSTSGVWI